MRWWPFDRGNKGAEEEAAKGEQSYQLPTVSIVLEDEKIADLYELLAISRGVLRDQLQVIEADVRALRGALKRCDRKKRPLEWARVQRSLGHALLVNGEWADEFGGSVDTTTLKRGVIVTSDHSGDAYLRDAASTYREALKVYTKPACPIEWASTQNNLGTALGALGLKLSETKEGPSLVESAINAYRSSLEVRTRETRPLEWALTKQNIGQALYYLAVMGVSGAERKTFAVGARMALEEACEVYKKNGNSQAVSALERQLSYVRKDFC